MKYLILFLLLLSPLASAATISDYPYLFVQKNGEFDAIYVIGDTAGSKDVISATVISTALAKYSNITTKIGTSKMDTQIANIKEYNAIVIGSPCENSAAAALQNNPSPCYGKLAANSGHIELYQNNGKYQLLITGLTEEDRYKAAKYLATRDLRALTYAKHIFITGTNSQPQYYQTRQGTVINTQNGSTPNIGVIYTESEQTEQKILDSSPIQTQLEKSAKSFAPQTKKAPGAYSPLKKIPPKKGLFSKFWTWLKTLFA